MAHDVTLEPYAARIHWAAPQPMAAEAWRVLLAEFAERVAHRSAEAGAPVIGHVKGFASESGGGYLNVSAVSADRPACVAGHLQDGLRELHLTLNVLVYGLSRQTLGALVGDIAAELSLRSQCHVAIEPTPCRRRFEGCHGEES